MRVPQRPALFGREQEVTKELGSDEVMQHHCQEPRDNNRAFNVALGRSVDPIASNLYGVVTGAQPLALDVLDPERRCLTEPETTIGHCVDHDLVVRLRHGFGQPCHLSSSEEVHIPCGLARGTDLAHRIARQIVGFHCGIKHQAQDVMTDVDVLLGQWPPFQDG